MSLKKERLSGTFLVVFFISRKQMAFHDLNISDVGTPIIIGGRVYEAYGISITEQELIAQSIKNIDEENDLIGQYTPLIKNYLEKWNIVNDTFSVNYEDITTFISFIQGELKNVSKANT